MWWYMKDIHSFVILAYGESDDLEECIKSIKKQSVKSNVLIATSTENEYIINLASEYGLGVMGAHNKEELIKALKDDFKGFTGSAKTKANDYNFCLDSVDTKLITIVHQNDLYDRNFAKEVINSYKKNKDASIIFTDSYLIVGDKKIKKNKNLFKKRLLSHFLKYKRLNHLKYFKRLSLKYQNTICTSSVTFVRKNIGDNLFSTDFKYNLDWDLFERLSLLPKRFVYIPLKLVGNRQDNKKEKNKTWIKEDITLYKRFWPEKLINYFYRNRQ